MSRTSAGSVVSHWHKLIENFQTSSLEFYTAVEAAIKRREIPDTLMSRVDWKEGGALSARREYLRVSRGNLICDICAAPFGTGFFFSSWVAEAPPKLGCLYLAVLAGGGLVVFALLARLFGAFGGVVAAIVLFPVALFFVGRLIHQGSFGSEEVVLSIPFLAPIYSWLFNPNAYYRTDTRLMFQESVHAAMLEVVDSLTKASGIRELSELERKPMQRELIR
jgi:hypothetical protein